MGDLGTMAIVGGITLWLIGAAIGAARLKEVSSDSPGLRIVIALIAWPIVLLS